MLFLDAVLPHMLQLPIWQLPQRLLSSLTIAQQQVTPYIPLSDAPTCPVQGPISCHNSTPTIDSCCFVHPGGRMLLTQFWDREVHAGGAEEDWTLHGLWPDNCDGSYDAYCSMTPYLNNITDILEHYGQAELVGFMNRYWLADRGSNNHLWAHEYNKHASCINTLAPSCYQDAYQLGIEVVDYFTRAASLFKMLDTYRALEAADIVPTLMRRYSRDTIQSALEKYSGGKVVLRCTGPRRDTLHEVWYMYFVKGSLQTGHFVPAQDLGDVGDKGNCAQGIRYQPKFGRRS